MPFRPPTVLDALAETLRTDPGRPLVTYYDGTTGERIELSVTTFDNWVCKIANLFSDELMLEPGALVACHLPTHWQVPVTLLGAWTAGLRVGAGAAGPADVSIVGPTALDEPRLAEGQVLACSLRPLGGAFAAPLPDGWLDFAREVPPQPDALLDPLTVTADDVAVESAAGPVTHEELVDQALAAAAEAQLVRGGRLVTDANPGRPDGLALALVAPIVTGSSVVLVANADAATRTSICSQERVTAQHWVTG